MHGKVAIRYSKIKLVNERRLRQKMRAGLTRSVHREEFVTAVDRKPVFELWSQPQMDLKTRTLPTVSDKIEQLRNVEKIAAFWLASATAASTSREPRQLLFPNPYSPFYRVQPVESRFGPGPRQSNSPINPMIAQQGLGPFFGYFPNLLTQPCPDCAVCAVCPNCTVCPDIPKVIPPPPAQNLTTCGAGANSTLSAAPNGTISLNIKSSLISSTSVCEFGLAAYYPNTTIQLTCTSLGTSTTFQVYPLVTPVTVGVANTDYASKGSFLFLNATNAADNSKDLTAESQQGLGPFFGYFPNLLTQPCPDCAVCAVCPNCTVCPDIPKVIPPPPAQNLTTCGAGANSTLSAAPNGTISLNIKSSLISSTSVCEFGLAAYYPNTTIQLTCTSLGTSTTFQVYPLVTPVTVGVANTDYASKGSFLFLNATNAADNSKDLTAECKWLTIHG
ncbi:hypothetical protein DAPPUDRAFT_314997 [Daphnia pulex]|uniref:Uncharacterized protein n=1 Tax=Daphnia pulex TaxID=6669 RepID=E9G8D1_DAPPU|nr:hypothetical protein DAPPUDRAFT_314997 [Daphnia pulex]|eukprot:EFX83956.1 hypothetical protein DAPPUDRAFT_314997 [Daphnia pulex]